jgi:hypothetical protein
MALRSTPLRKISAKLLGTYTDAVSAGRVEDRADELRYFLPRYFELIAADDPPDDMGMDICLRRMLEMQWRDRWPIKEVNVINTFFKAKFVAALQNTALSRPPALGLSYDLGVLLTMIVTAGGDLNTILDAWDSAPDPQAALHMASLRGSVKGGSEPKFINAYLSHEHDDARLVIGRFLARIEVDSRLETLFFQLDDPRHQQLVSDAMWIF